MAGRSPDGKRKMNSPEFKVNYAVFETDWGWIGAAGSPVGLMTLSLPRAKSGDALMLLGEHAMKGCENVVLFQDLAKELRSYLAGKPVEFNDRLDLAEATRFQREVWTMTRQIPYGESRSYSWIASRLGNPGACRAVGQALGQNPLPILIPCHRVLAASGAVGGFSGGLDIKKRLLQLEDIHFS